MRDQDADSKILLLMLKNLATGRLQKRNPFPNSIVATHKRSNLSGTFETFVWTNFELFAQASKPISCADSCLAEVGLIRSLQDRRVLSQQHLL